MRERAHWEKPDHGSNLCTVLVKLIFIIHSYCRLILESCKSRLAALRRCTMHSSELMICRRCMTEAI